MLAHAQLALKLRLDSGTIPTADISGLRDAMSFQQRLREIQTGFEPAFWVANFTEIFERVAYYATTAVLAIYLSEQLHFSTELTAWLMSIFGFVVWFLPILGGTLADRFGFRRALMFAYLIMTLGYFLLGSFSTPWMAPIRHALTDKWLVFAILMIPAMGPGVVKPCVAGTTARASNENVRSIGYAIYYTLVNIGGTIGPSMAFLIRKQLGWGIETVFRVAAGSVFLMFWVTLLFFREPSRLREEKVGSVLSAISNMFVVLANIRFLFFLAIVSAFYVVFWQVYIGMPLFVRGFVNRDAGVDATIAVEAFTVICCQVLVTYLTRKIPTFRAIAIGILVTGLSWLILALPIPAGEATVHLGFATFTLYRVTLYVAAALFVLALGEVTLSARYYDYISRLAPPGQQGLYMGYAFLPVAVGYLIAGPVAGYLLHEFGDVLHRPQEMWWCISAIGVVASIVMLLYNRIVKLPPEGTAS